jgi:benzoyl-CoA reductase/2-hydroxyglutaryl-CoA dehydratase subunit BcrC/BadD/HgdB
MAAKSEPKIKKFESTKEMNALMRDYFVELWDASQSDVEKVAWCTSVGPAEILRSLGFKVYFPENHGAMLGAARLSTDLIPKANAIGYSPDICSYLTSDVGAYMARITPMSKVDERIKGVPRPDVLVYNTNQCRDVLDWFSWFGREFKVPVLGIQTYRGVGEVTNVHIEGVTGQMKKLAKDLEPIAGKKFDMDALKETVRLSRRCSDLWKEVLDTAGHVPAPLTFFDGTILMGPAVVLRGDPRANAFYEHLLTELKGRIGSGTGAVDGEKFRIYWEGMPIWGKLRDNATLMMTLKTNVVASTYCNSWIFSAFDPGQPFESMARAYTELFIVRSDQEKERYIDEMVRFFKIDGIIFHDAKTCPNNSNNRYGMPERYKDLKKIPTLVINGDLNDLRCYSEEQARTNIEAFIEQLAERKN